MFSSWSPADKPHNPMVNAGAIVCTSLIKVRPQQHLLLVREETDSTAPPAG